ncbi:putative origin recognition complex subunit 1, putative,cell division cycle 6 [Trypanosoma grayi]|uniref:putative origin recognition complex subunit 1, putative,cell division cycle 6 n=1 Tax=Trypanosoma grayi TaxID=71804 RepID=UPI0004F45267|nr:putative origin recognition complex subunit 1, putative,cell division cycle 6 [Trypanosoma grayi]KEG14097.1 putative origin recognition complex subunit 1, putative,cell division cycle 6 [Trypanosoma grayi]
MKPELFVKNANDELKPFDTEKIRHRLEVLSRDLDTENVDIDRLTKSVVDGVYDAITTTELDRLVSETAAYAVTKHPHYGLLGGRLCVAALHKKTNDSVLETFRILFNYRIPGTERWAPLVSEETWKIVVEHHTELQDMIDYKRDMNFDFFGYRTLERSYLLRVKTAEGEMKIIERPQHMFLRVAIGIHGADMQHVKETYDYMSLGFFTHATPTLFNAGTPVPQMSSCFLVAMRDDSIEGIYDTLKQCAIISKSAGGIGIHVHNIRCAGSYIAGTNGTSNGLVPMLRVWNNTARYVDQGGGRRKGAIAIYLEPWHGDIMNFLLLKKNTGKEDMRARDLFYALWVPDLFMERVEKHENWTLMDPHTAPGLSDCYGNDFKKLYERYESEGRGVKTMKAQEVWFAILETQMETGVPFLVYKDACNKKSNQNNIGVIKCSNLCTEIVEYSSPKEIAVCNLASIALPRFLNNKVEFDHQRLYEVTKVVTRNLNKVIDRNHYPLKEARDSNMLNRPIGIGVQGLADLFALMRLPFTDIKARELNEDIFETIYYGAVVASVELAEEEERYARFNGSPASEGKLQFDLWDEKPKSGRWNWDELKKRVETSGMRNSLLVAPMPTASTSQILGNNECFEPFTSNIYVRRVLSGEFPVVNKYLVMDLIKRNLWSDEMRNQIIANDGSVQKIKAIPDDLKELYKVVWEIKQRDLIDMAVDRGKYIDQSQSLNLFLESPTSGQLTSMHFYAWKKGLKTGVYYLRSRPSVDAIKFTVDPKTVKLAKEANGTPPVTPTGQPGEDCFYCGS